MCCARCFSCRRRRLCANLSAHSWWLGLERFLLLPVACCKIRYTVRLYVHLYNCARDTHVVNCMHTTWHIWKILSRFTLHFIRRLCVCIECRRSRRPVLCVSKSNKIKKIHNTRTPFILHLLNTHIRINDERKTREQVCERAREQARTYSSHNGLLFINEWCAEQWNYR